MTESRDTPASDDLDERYHRAAALGSGRASDSVRRSVFAEAARLAAERRAPSSRARQTWRRPALLGMLAAAASTAVVLSPRLLRPGIPYSAAIRASDVVATTVAPAPASVAPANSESAPDNVARAVAKAPRVARAAPATAVDAGSVSTSSAGAPAAPTGPLLAAQVAPSMAQPFASARSSASTERTGGARTDAAMDLNASDGGETLRGAAARGDLTLLRALLAEPRDINAPDEAGRTALMLATLNRHALAVGVLLEHRADPNVADSHGVTALGAAAMLQEPDIIDALKRAGAR